MKNILKAYFILLLICFSGSAGAQIVIQKDSIGEAELTIAMDKRVSDELAALENKCNKSAATPKTGSTAAAPSKKLSTAEICKQNPRILGYKIQVAVVKSKAEADEIGLEFRKKFPAIKIEIDASLRPNYKVLAGSFFSKESAAPDLKKVRAEFKGATSVQYRVFCVEAK